MSTNDSVKFFRWLQELPDVGSGQLCRAITASMHFFVQVKTYLVSTSCIYMR